MRRWREFVCLASFCLCSGHGGCSCTPMRPREGVVYCRRCTQRLVTDEPVRAPRGRERAS